MFKKPIVNYRSLLRSYAVRIALILLFLFLCTAPAASQPYRTRPAEPIFSMKDYLGKKLLLFIYDIDSPNAAFLTGRINELYKIRNEYNFNIVGICLNRDSADRVEQFEYKNGMSFKNILDYNKKASQKLRMRGKLAVYLLNKNGKGMARKFFHDKQDHESLSNILNSFTSRYLNIPNIPRDMPVLGIKPKVPLFTAETFDNSTLRIKDIYEKKPVIVIIFSPLCIHCKKELSFLKGLYSSKPLKDRFEIVAISVKNGAPLEKLVEKQKYPFPVVPDPLKKIISLFPSYTGSVPLSYIIDKKGRINFLHRGFSEYIKNQYIMEIKKLLNLNNPPLLNKAGYTGEKICLICHEDEHNQWRLTPHSNAFHSLLRKGKEEDTECVACHVTGYGKQGGYNLKNKKHSSRLKNVQCEACHGPGYKSCPAFTGKETKKKKLSEWKKICLSCHTEKESLNFNFSGRLKKIRHSNSPDLSSMSRDERLNLARKIKEQQTVFANPARYMGKDACKKCHEKEFSHWQTTAHARAHLSERAKSSSEEKLFRYNTLMDPDGDKAEKGLEGVQCEACHGPGERHINNPEAKGQDFIVGLGMECPSCVVEQICRQCHSVNDDPDFEFEKQFDKIRHK